MNDTHKHSVTRRAWMIAGFLIVVLGAGSIGISYFLVARRTVAIENAQLSAPVVNLSPKSPGVLQKLYVSEGDTVAPDSVVAQVGVELIKTESGGLVVTANNNVGKLINPGEPVVSIIDPSALRVIGQIDEDKGLADIKVGQPARFTVDAFGGKNFSGVIDEVSPTSHTGDIAFSISDKRETHKFDVKVRFNPSLHPELKNGMSARIWVYKK